MKKYYIKITTLITYIEYLNEQDNKIVNLFQFPTRYKFIYEKNDFSFELNNQDSETYPLFDDEVKPLVKVKFKKEYLIKLYIDYILSLLDDSKKEIIFISCINKKDDEKLIMKLLYDLKHNTFKIYKNLFIIQDIILYFNVNYFNQVMNANFMYVDDIICTFTNEEVKCSFCDNLVYKFYYSSLINKVSEQYYDKFPHNILANNESTKYNDIILANIKKILINRLLLNQNDYAIYFRDYKISIEELEGDNLYLNFKVDQLFESIKNQQNITNHDINIVFNFINDKLKDYFINQSIELGFNLNIIDSKTYLNNLYQYLYNIAFLNESYKLTFDHYINSKKGGAKIASMRQRFMYIDKLYFKDKELIKEYPTYQSSVFNIEMIKDKIKV